jgi:hypothetical protein
MRWDVIRLRSQLTLPPPCMQLPGQQETCTALMTIPANYLDLGQIKATGIILGHGADAEDWRGPLLGGVAEHFAKQGKVEEPWRLRGRGWGGGSACAASSCSTATANDKRPPLSSPPSTALTLPSTPSTPSPFPPNPSGPAQATLSCAPTASKRSNGVSASSKRRSTRAQPHPLQSRSSSGCWQAMRAGHASPLQWGPRPVGCWRASLSSLTRSW